MKLMYLFSHPLYYMRIKKTCCSIIFHFWQKNWNKREKKLKCLKVTKTFTSLLKLRGMCYKTFYHLLPCLPVFTSFYFFLPFLPLFTAFYLFLPLCTTLYHFISLYIPLYHFTPLYTTFTTFCHLSPLFTTFYHFLPQ
jgi:hypothetical protein